MDNEKNPVDQQKRESNKKKLYITLSLILFLLISLAIVLPIVLTNKEQKIVALDFISSSSFVYGEDISNQDIIITYEDNSDEKIKFNQLEINKDDLAKLKNVGEYIITVTYKDFSTELTITILPADFTNLEKEKMLIDNKFFEYDGENKHFLTSYLPEGAVALYSVNNEDDFKIDYSITEIGTYTIYVKVSKQNFNDFVFSFDIEIIDTTIKIDGFEENEGVFTKRVSNGVNEIGIYSLIKTSDKNAKVKIYLDEMLTQEVQDTILLENLQTKIFIKLYFDNNDLIKIYQVIVTKNDLFTINFYLKDTLLGNEFIEEGDYLQQPSYTVEGYNIVGWKINDDLISFPFQPNYDVDIYAEYSLVYYNIKYNLQDGSISGEKLSFSVEDETFTLVMPTKNGYEFIGWTWEGQTEPQLTVTIEKGTTGNKEYTANWIEKTYFISKGTTSNGSFDIVSEGKYNEEISLTVSPEDGYKVVQTYYVLDGQEQKITIVNQRFNMPASNIVVYVVFEKVDYTLEGVQTSHGTFSLSKTGANLGDEITINVTPDNGYEVFKVYYEIVGDNIENKIENLKFIMPAGNIKVYVEFNAIIYTISYDLNDGQIVGQKESYTIEDETFTLEEPVKYGYNFIGWTWEGQIEPQKVVTISQGTTGNKEYTANWEIKKYTVTIQENDAYEIIKEQDNVEHGSDYKFKIVLNEAYTQSNVVVKNDEEIIELGEDGFYTITNVTKDVEILIEGIVKNKYKITWQNYDGSELEVDENVEHGTIPNYDGETPIKESDEQYDYIFDGWNTQITAAKEDKVYVAIFKNQLRKYTITFGENILIEKISGGNINSGEQVDYGTQIKIIYQESLGYRKVNFKVNGNEVENNYITMVNGNINIEFIKEAISYSILYNLDGGQIEGQRESYTIEDETFALKEPMKEGYEFVGWTWDGQDVPQKVVTINKGTTGDKEYTANWDLIEYTITYFLNEGMMSGEVKTYTIEDETFVLPTPTKRGYEFLGWTGTDLSGQNMIVEIIKGSTGNREYTANWKINQYTYTFYNNNEVYYTRTIDYGTTINIPDDPTKGSIDGTNYHFTGWDKEIPLVISDQNIDFYAQYSEEEFSKGLNFTYIESEDSYIVDKGTVEDIDVIVPATYNNKKVTEIAEYGFSDMINMQTITFGEYVENIGKGAFQNCEKLSSVSGLDNIKTIPEYAFANTSLLEEFEIGENVIIIGSYAFAVSGIKVVNIPASVIAIEENAFESCNNLVSVTIPASIEEMKCSFRRCANLESIIFEGGSKLKEISSEEFSECKKLKSITIPSSIEIIGANAFDSCESLEEVIFEEESKLISINDLSFRKCSKLQTVVFDNEYLFTNSTDSWELFKNVLTIKVKDTITAMASDFIQTNYECIGNENGYNIYKKTFIISKDIPVGGEITCSLNQCLEGTEVEVTVTANDGYYLTNVYYIIDGQSDKNIITKNESGKYLFTMPQGNVKVYADFGQEITGFEFNGNTLVTYNGDSSIVNVPQSYSIVNIEGVNKIVEGEEILVSKIGDNAFEGNTTITNVILPKTITDIGQSAFLMCSSLEEINLPEDLKTIGEMAFAFTKINNLIIPKNVTEIVGICYLCTNLENVSFAEESQLKTIGASSFTMCSKLTSIIIPSLVTEIGSGAFYSCTNLKEVVFSSSIEKIESEAFYASGIETLTFGNTSSLAIIGNEAFQDCPNLTTVVIPETVNSIGESAFAGCSNLINVSFEDNIQLLSLYQFVFSNCTSLEQIIIPESVKYINPNVFNGCSKLTYIYFENKTGWKVSEQEITEEQLTPANAALLLKETYLSEVWTRQEI